MQGYTQRVNRINALEDEIEELSDEALKAKTEEFRGRLAAGETEDDLLEEAFAVVREAAWRAIDLRHYDVQLVGAMALHEGFLAGAQRAHSPSLSRAPVAPILPRATRQRWARARASPSRAPAQSTSTRSQARAT